MATASRFPAHPMDIINELTACIESCESKLGSTHEKVIAQLGKKLIPLAKKRETAQSRVAAQRTKYRAAKDALSAKKTAVNQVRVAKQKERLSELQAALATLKSECTVIKGHLNAVRASQKKQLARLKVITQFEKKWQKRIAKKTKPARASTRKKMKHT